VLIGGHVSSAGGIWTAIDRIEAIGGNAVQLFTQSPRMWRPTQHDPASLERFRDRRREARVGYALCHALYLVNLASPDDEVYEKSVTALVATVDVARAIDADIVLHVGSHLGAGLEAGLARAVPALGRALEHAGGDVWLLLENSAGAGGTIGRSVEELAAIVEALGRPPRLGICLDSCHLWVSGVDVTDRAEVDALLEEVDSRLGLDRLRAVHVNDAAAPLGSNRDRHANLGEGSMGRGLAAFVVHPLLRELPQLLETPGKDGHGPDADEIRALKALRRRRSASS
jgi:deoxyribonuclease-4